MTTFRTLILASPLLCSLAFAQPAAAPFPEPPANPPVSTEPAVMVSAEPIRGQNEQPAATGETTLTLDIGFGIRAVPPSRVTVPSGDRLRILAPELGIPGTIIWTRNGRAIPGADTHVLTLEHVTTADAGVYAWMISTPETLPRTSQTLILGVGPTDRLVNLSTRGRVGSGEAESLTSGFVVSGPRAKKIILRAIGPSLALFGVADPLARPVLRVFDGRGNVYENGFVYAAVVGGPTYESDLAESLARSGAFPLPPGTDDVVLMMPFNRGTYTAQVTSADGSAGEVLLEIYEVP